MKAPLEKVATLIGIPAAEAEELRGPVFAKKDPQDLEAAVRAYCQWLREGGAAKMSVEVEIRKETLAKLKAERRMAEAKASGSGQTLADCAAVLGVKTDTLKKWHTQGCPGQKTNGGTWKFEVGEVFAWRIERERELCRPVAADEAEAGEFLNPEQERARKDKEMADKTALENRVRRGELVEAAEVESVWSDHVAAARARLLSLGPKLAPILAAEQRPAVVEAEISKAAAEVAQALADDAID